MRPWGPPTASPAGRPAGPGPCGPSPGGSPWPPCWPAGAGSCGSAADRRRSPPPATPALPRPPGPPRPPPRALIRSDDTVVYFLVEDDGTQLAPGPYLIPVARSLRGPLPPRHRPGGADPGLPADRHLSGGGGRRPAPRLRHPRGHPAPGSRGVRRHRHRRPLLRVRSGSRHAAPRGRAWPRWSSPSPASTRSTASASWSKGCRPPSTRQRRDDRRRPGHPCRLRGPAPGDPHREPGLLGERRGEPAGGDRHRQRLRGHGEPGTARPGRRRALGRLHHRHLRHRLPRGLRHRDPLRGGRGPTGHPRRLGDLHGGRAPHQRAAAPGVAERLRRGHHHHPRPHRRPARRALRPRQGGRSHPGRDRDHRRPTGGPAPGPGDRPAHATPPSSTSTLFELRDGLGRVYDELQALDADFDHPLLGGGARLGVGRPAGAARRRGRAALRDLRGGPGLRLGGSGKPGLDPATFSYSFGESRRPGGLLAARWSSSTTSRCTTSPTCCSAPSARSRTGGPTIYAWPSAQAYGSWAEVPEAEREALRPCTTTWTSPPFEEFGGYLGYRVGHQPRTANRHSGSTPSPATDLPAPGARRPPAGLRRVRRLSTLAPIVLGGALGVPCTRNPLYAGLNPPPEGFGCRAERRARGDEGRVLRGGTTVNRVRSGRKQP